MGRKGGQQSKILNTQKVRHNKKFFDQKLEATKLDNLQSQI